MAPARDGETLHSRDPEGTVSPATRNHQPESRRKRLIHKVNRLFSPKAYLLILTTAALGVVLGRALIPFPIASGIAGLAGITMGSFVIGVTGGPRRYLEAATAGATAAGLAALLEFVSLPIAGLLGFPLVTIGIIAGALAAGIGLYFGRDLHNGLTRDL